MRRRTLLVAVAGLAVVVAAVVVVVWPSQPNRITQENCDRIKEGMSRAEVEAILGPPGDYSSGPLEFARETPGPHPTGDFEMSHRVTLFDTDADRVEWRSDRQILCVYFLRSGVAAKGFWDVAPMAQSPLDALLWRARRQWHRWFP
jgi:hypothetical protein